jgi:uncharacterized protein (DUF2267 family)
MTSMTGPDVFDTTIHKTNSWPKEIMEELGIDNRHQAYQALRGTLQALRDRLPLGKATHLGAQLPMKMRVQFSFAKEETLVSFPWGTAGADGRRAVPK